MIESVGHANSIEEAKELKKKLDALEQAFRTLTEENERLRAENNQLRAERSSYRS